MRKYSILLLGSVMALCGSVLAQGQKTLLIQQPMGNDPIRIVKIMEGTTELTSDGHQFPNPYLWESVFNAGDDWIKDISFVVRNVSKKTISHVTVSGVLRETADWQGEMAKHKTEPILGQANNAVGWRPEHALYSTRQQKWGLPDSTRRPALILGPKQELTILLEDPKNYESLRSKVEERIPISNINACDVSVIFVFFDDGTMWQGHNYYRAADKPGKWAIISFEDWARSTQ